MLKKDFVLSDNFMILNVNKILDKILSDNFMILNVKKILKNFKILKLKLTLNFLILNHVNHYLILSNKRRS